MITYYRIVCKDPLITDCYVGSGKNYTKIKCNHKYNCNNPKSNDHNFKVYQFIRNHNGFDNFRFEVLNTQEFINNLLQRQKVQEYIAFYKPTLNMVGPCMSEEERVECKKTYRKTEKSKTYDKEYEQTYQCKERRRTKRILDNFKKLLDEHAKKILMLSFSPINF